jgi:ABC-type glutathione transport system ATPase component
VLGLVGESGCGKSTIAKTISGLEPVTAGTLTYQGRPVQPLGIRKRSREALGIQMVFQNPYASLNPRRRVGDLIADGLRISQDTSAWDVTSLLRAVELEPSAVRRYPHQFSGGQRQRIAIARALASSPDVLIGDEPIASLDASLQSKLAELMRDLALETGAALLFISHDLSVVRVIADRVAVMREGLIVESGETESVWNAPARAYTRELIAAIPRADGKRTLPGTGE